MSVGTTAAIGIAAGVGAAGSIGSGLINASAAKSAANTQQQGAQQASNIATQAGTDANAKIGDVLSQQKSLLQPYIDIGNNGLSSLSAAIAPGGSLTNQFSFDPTQIANNPNYQFQLQQGLEAVQRAASATGTLGSGATIKAATQYGQGLASNEIAQSYQQALSTYNTNRNTTLQNLQLPLQVGQTGTSELLNALQNYGNLYSANTINTANTVGNDLTAGANAKAAGTVGAANAYSSAIGGVSNALQFGALTLGGLPSQGPSGTTLAQTATNYNSSLYNLPLPAPAPTAFGATPGLSGYLNYYGSPTG